MTVSNERKLDMEKLSSLLDALPEVDRYFLVYCCDDAAFKVSRVQELSTSGGRLSRLSILRLNMQPVGRAAPAREAALEAAAAGIVAEPAAPAPAARRKRVHPDPTAAPPGSQPAGAEAAASRYDLRSRKRSS